MLVQKLYFIRIFFFFSRRHFPTSIVLYRANNRMMTSQITTGDNQLKTADVCYINKTFRDLSTQMGGKRLISNESFLTNRGQENPDTVQVLTSLKTNPNTLCLPIDFTGVSQTGPLNYAALPSERRANSIALSMAAGSGTGRRRG